MTLPNNIHLRIKIFLILNPSLRIQCFSLLLGINSVERKKSGKTFIRDNKYSYCCATKTLKYVVRWLRFS